MKNTEVETRGSETARRWANQQAETFGNAVRHHRQAAGMSAVQLATRTEGVGYPITRGTIAKIEGNHRSGKVDVAEVAALARALDVPPIALLYPDLADGAVEFLPGRTVKSIEAVRWFGGESRDAADYDLAVPYQPTESKALNQVRAARHLDTLRDLTSSKLLAGLIGDLRGSSQDAEVAKQLQAMVAELTERCREWGMTIEDE